MPLVHSGRIAELNTIRRSAGSLDRQRTVRRRCSNSDVAVSIDGQPLGRGGPEIQTVLVNSGAALRGNGLAAGFDSETQRIGQSTGVGSVAIERQATRN